MAGSAEVYWFGSSVVWFAVVQFILRDAILQDNDETGLFRGGFQGSVKNVGVVVTLIYFRALFFLKNDWF